MAIRFLLDTEYGLKKKSSISCMASSNVKESLIMLWCIMGISIAHSFWTLGPEFDTEAWIITIGFTGAIIPLVTLAAYKIMTSIEQKCGRK